MSLLGTHNNNPHPPTTQQLPTSKHHSSIVGPGTTNCVGYRQNFILSDFSSLTEELSAMCDLVLPCTYVISWWWHLEHTATTHTLQPLNTYHPQHTTHHHGEYELLPWRMPKKTHDTWQLVLSSAWRSQKVYISTVFQLCSIRRCVCTTWL